MTYMMMSSINESDIVSKGGILYNTSFLKSKSSSILFFDFYKQDLDCFHIMFHQFHNKVHPHRDVFGLSESYGIRVNHSVPLPYNSEDFRFFFSHVSYVLTFDTDKWFKARGADWAYNYFYIPSLYPLLTPIESIIGFLPYPISILDSLIQFMNLRTLRGLQWINWYLSILGIEDVTDIWTVNEIYVYFEDNTRLLTDAVYCVLEFIRYWSFYYTFGDILSVFLMIYEDYLTPDQAYYINAQSLGFDFCYLNKRINFFGELFDELNREGVTFRQPGILNSSNFDLPKRLDLIQFDFTNQGRLIACSPNSDFNNIHINNVAKFFSFSTNEVYGSLFLKQFNQLYFNCPQFFLDMMSPYKSSSDNIYGIKFILDWFLGPYSSELDYNETLYYAVPYILDGIPSIKKATVLFLYETLMYFMCN